MQNKVQKFAIIGPEFFSYIKAIKNELNSRRIPCEFYDERHSNNVFSKIIYRLQLDFFLYKKKQDHLDQIFDSIITTHITDVILIATEVVNNSFVKQLQQIGIRVHLYIWDSFRNKKSCLALLENVKNVASFDPTDCKKYSLTYIPLFAESIFQEKPINQKKLNQIVFNGTLHSNRPNMLIKVEKYLRKSEFTLVNLAYYYTRPLYIIKSLANPNIIKYLFKLSTSGFSKQEIAKNFFRSKAVIDFHHQDQDGLTSRTFETLRAGCWLISFNKTIELLPKNLRHRVIYLDSIDHLPRNLNKLKQELPKLEAVDDYYLSLERFVDDLLAFVNNKPVKK